MAGDLSKDFLMLLEDAAAYYEAGFMYVIHKQKSSFSYLLKAGMNAALMLRSHIAG